MAADPTPEHDLPTPRKPLGAWQLADWALSAAGLLLFLWLFSVMTSHLGALWRDEVGSAWLVRLDTWRWMFGGVREDSFPPLFNVCLRLWILLGDTSDAWLQSWGYITVAGLVAALWWSTRSPARTWPVLSVALVFFNPTMFYWGHSVRAYGLAAALVVLFFGAIWRFLERPTRATFAVATLVAILNAQASYQNAPLVLAISLSAAGVAALRRRWWRSVLLLVPGFVSALTLLIHLKAIFYVQTWNIMIRQTFGVGWIFEKMGEALGSAGIAFVWLWALLVVALGAIAIRLWIHERRGGFDREPVRVATYSFLTIVLSLGLVIVFILHVGYPTQEWYYVPLMGLWAAALELGFSPFATAIPYRAARLGVALLLIAGSVSTMWERAHLRRTNVDLIAAKLRTESTPADLIIVRPFYCGMVFQYYYKGSTPWTTLPPIAWSEMHNCYDTVRHYVEQNEPMGSTIERIAQTLRAGGRVFFVGGISFLPKGELPPASPPAPHPKFGWSDEIYSQIWAMQIGYFLQNHVTAASVIEVPVGSKVQAFENLPLVQVSGWRP